MLNGHIRKMEMNMGEMAKVSFDRDQIRAINVR
jgi:hypothetical protein